VFDEASAWWSSKYIVQPDTYQHEAHIKDTTREDQDATCEEDKSPTSSTTKSPWRTGIHKGDERATPNMLEELEEIPPLIWRSARIRRPNPKFANAAIAEEDLEPIIYEETAKKDKWRKVMEE
jgi:hypothetical protein